MSRSARTARIEIGEPDFMEKLGLSRSARTARIEIGAIANLLGSILAVAVRKDRED